MPPKAWKPSKVAHLENREVVISRPIEQKVTGKQGVYQALLLERKEMSLQREFVPLAADPENQPPKYAKPEDLEREFWRSMNRHAPIYGADVEASFFDKSMKVRTAAATHGLRCHVQYERVIWAGSHSSRNYADLEHATPRQPVDQSPGGPASWGEHAILVFWHVAELLWLVRL